MLSPRVQLSSILLFLIAFTNSIRGLPITPIIQNLTFNEYYYQPAVQLIYEVDREDLQKYIDPRFKVVSPYGNDSAYLVLQIGNITAYYNGGPCYHCATFTYLQSVFIYTVVQYNNTLYREVLSTSFNFTPPAVVGNLYQDPPYGSSMINPGLKFSSDNQTGDYYFSSSTLIPLNCQLINTAMIDLTLNFNSSNIANSTNQPALSEFYLGEQNNRNGIQSSYRKCNNNITIANDIRTGYLTEFLYTALLDCSNVTVTSTYIKSTVGDITGLDEANPAACYYVPYLHYNSVAVTPIQLQT